MLRNIETRVISYIHSLHCRTDGLHMAQRKAGEDRGGERQTMQTEARTGRDRRCRQRQEQGETDDADRGKNRESQTMQTEARTGRDRRCRQRQEQGETDDADRGRERQMM